MSLNTKHCVDDAMGAYYGRANETLRRILDEMAREIETLRNIELHLPAGDPRQLRVVMTDRKPDGTKQLCVEIIDPPQTTNQL